VFLHLQHLRLRQMDIAMMATVARSSLTKGQVLRYIYIPSSFDGTQFLGML